MTSERFLSPEWHRVAALRPRTRSHVRMFRHRYRGTAWYVVHDELGSRQYRFSAATYLFIGLMDGRRSVDDLWNEVVSRIGDDAPTQGEVIRLLGQLHGADLLQCDVSPDAKELLERAAHHSRRKLRGRLGNPLSIKFPLLDPDRFLEQTLTLVGPLFSRAGLLVWTATVAAALVLVAMHWPELSDNFTDRVMTGENLLLVALIYPVLKALHELGHGYATRRFDGPVHEFGVMLLVLMPVPYADASASSAFRSKWHRITVGAAGMLVEGFVASIAVFVWVMAEPGTVRVIAYNTMLIGGVSTLLFNANPLLRFDGYYILCDLLEIPNLAQRSSQFWQWLVERFAFRLEVEAPNASRGEIAWFIVYAPLALVYRLTIMFGIAIFVASSFAFVGAIIAIVAVITNLALPLGKATIYLLTSGRLRERRARALTIGFGGAGGLVLLLMFAPLPLHSVAEGVLWLPEDSIVRARSDGFVTALAALPGTAVAPGTPLVEAEDPTVLISVRMLEAQVAALQARLTSEEFTDRVQADLTRQELEIKIAGLQRQRERLDQLTVRSAAAGTLVMPRAADLVGRFYKRGDVMGYVTSSEGRIVRAVVTQADIDLVRERLNGIEVRMLDRPDRSYQAKLVREVPAGSEQLPSKALAEIGGGRLAADPRDQNQTRTLQRTFQFDLELLGAAATHYGSRVWVRFDHGSEPLGTQWYRRLRQLFLSRFDA